MDELNVYNNAIISLYNQGFSLNYITDFLYKKINTRLKTFNKLSNGELWVSIPKISKADCSGHVYKIIYIDKIKKQKGGNKNGQN